MNSAIAKGEPVANNTLAEGLACAAIPDNFFAKQLQTVRDKVQTKETTRACAN